MPHVDPWHVKPKPFPHREFVETWRADEGLVDAAVRVLVTNVVLGLAVEEDPEHVPNSGLQPVPQYVEVDLQ